MQSESRRSLEVYLLGLVDFEDAQLLQGRLVYELGEGTVGGALVLCEHPPVISVGRLGSRFHVDADDDELKARGIPLRWVNRGGGCVLHLPGQITGYLALSLDAAELTVQGYVDGLHRALVAVLAEFDLPGVTHDGFDGVFVGRSRVASVGVAVKRYIAYHGFTINVGAYLEPFRLLRLPGPGGAELRQTSLEAQRQRQAPMPRVREALIRQIETAFKFEHHHIYTHHPMIRRKARPHAYAQSHG